jgi:preprotein translocase subunit YajC
LGFVEADWSIRLKFAREFNNFKAEQMSLMIFLEGGGAGALIGMWPIILMFVVIYFFMIRPQAKKTKNQNTFVKELAKGDEVVLSSGIVGKITKLEDDFVQLQVDNKTYLRVAKASVSKEMSDLLEVKKEEKE